MYWSQKNLNLTVHSFWRSQRHIGVNMIKQLTYSVYTDIIRY